MSYETDNLKREIDNLKYQKVENYRFGNLEQKVLQLVGIFQDTLNTISSIEERLFKLEQKELERENVI
jgi:hypothetical protein